MTMYNLDESISTMIKKWSFVKFNKDLEYKYRGEKEYIDKRGKISNYELTEPINLIGYIESIKGSMRANHLFGLTWENAEKIRRLNHVRLRMRSISLSVSAPLSPFGARIEPLPRIAACLCRDLCALPVVFAGGAATNFSPSAAPGVSPTLDI